MPFRRATALVSVEREGVVSTQVVELTSGHPTVDVKVQEGLGVPTSMSACWLCVAV